MTARHKILCSLAMVLFFCNGAPSDEKVSDENVETVSKALASLASTYNSRDPKAIAELFTPHGEFIDADGNVFDSHEAISSEFAALFEINAKNTIEIEAEEIREISPGVLSVDCEATITATEGAVTDDIDFSVLLVKQSDGRWLLASIRSDGEVSIRTPHARLKELEWLIGEWVDESDDSTMHTNTNWSEDGNFILTDFKILVAGHNVMSGTQRVGWDASLDKFHSWVFDSEGGHAEGIWTQIDDRWIVKVTGVRADGDSSSATNVYDLIRPDAYIFSVVDRTVADEAEPDFTATVVKRPPAPKSDVKGTSPRGN